MDLVSPGAFLKAFPSAKGLDSRDLRDLLGGMRAMELLEGQALFDAGDEPGPAYLILSGAVRIERQVDHGRTVLLGRLGAGNFVGDMSLIEGTPRAASAVVEGETALLELKVGVFERMRGDAHPAALWLIGEIDRNVAVRIREMVERLAQLRDDPSLAAEPAAVQAEQQPWYARWRGLLGGR